MCLQSGTTDCGGDNCCEEGNYNTGIAVSRTTGDVYTANECPTGKVLHFNQAGVLQGAPIDIGTFPSGINVSRRSSFACPPVACRHD